MTNFVILMLACGLVTWIPRIVPFYFLKARISETFHHLFELLAVVYFGGIVGSKFADLSRRAIPILKVKETIACIPALLVGYYTKDLMKIVITGVIAMALLRFFF